MKTTKDHPIARNQRLGATRTIAWRMKPVALALIGAWSMHALAQTAPSSTDVLPTVTVTGDNDSTTEGSDSYVAKRANVGSRTDESIQETPASVSVLTRQRMDDQNMTTIQEALRYVTGVTSVDYGDGTAYLRARGTELGIEFDGVSIISGLQFQPQFDLAMYDRVEVLRGPSGVMDGFGEPGGTVNLVRKRPLDQFKVSTETQIDTFGSVRQEVDVTGPLNKDGSLRGRAVLLGSDGLQSVDHTRAKEVMAYGALDYDIDPRTTVSVSGGYQVNPVSGLDYGAGAVYDSTGTTALGRVPSSYSQNFSPSWNYSYTSIAEANADIVHRFENGWKAEATVFYRHEYLKSDYAYSGPGATTDGLSFYGDQRQQASYDWFGFDTHASGPIEAFGQKHILTVGANYSVLSDTSSFGFQAVNGPFDQGMYNLFDPNSVPSVDVPFTGTTNTRIVQYGVYAQARVKVADPLTIVLGAREAFLQEQSQNTLPTVTDWSTDAQINHRFLPSAGIVWDIVPSMTAYANYARFLSAQTQTTYTGTGLPPRTGEQYELGIKNSFLGGRLDTTAALFRINDNDRAIADPDHPDGSIPGGKVRDQGVEFEVNGKPTENWNIYAGYTFLNERFENDAPDSTDGTDPKHLFKLWTNYRFSSGWLRGVSVGGGMLAQTAVSRVYEQGGYAIVNALVGYQVNKHVDVTLTVNNLFNRDYYLRPPGTFFSVFGDKRNAVLTVRSDF